MGPQEGLAIPRRRGRTPRVPVSQLLPALTFHALSGAGTLAEYVSQVFGESLADRSWADRRARLPWALFAGLMRRALRPRAPRRRHPDAFWRGGRLVALDGTQFSLPNTAQITAAVPKAKTRRGRAAFAKRPTAVLLELGLHNPLAAAIGRQGPSARALAHELVAQLPRGVLLLADRLYGCAAFAAPALAVCQRVGSHFLLRARTDIKPGVIQRLADGRRLIGVAVHDPVKPSRIVDWLDLREIRVQVRRPGRRAHVLRLWTSLLDPKVAPALDLAQLSARRWEHELYDRNLTHVLRKTDRLQSQTVETAAQEVAALVLASALLATERARAAAGDVPVLPISFVNVLGVVQSLWLFLGPFADLLTDPQKDQIVQRGYALMGHSLTPKRRPRSNPRAVRQPVRKWPRLMETHSVEGALQFTIV